MRGIWELAADAAGIRRSEAGGITQAGRCRPVRVTVKTLTREAEVTVWESGEADLLIGNMVTGEIEAIEHAELTTRFGARGLLEDMARAVRDVG